MTNPLAELWHNDWVQGDQLLLTLTLIDVCINSEIFPLSKPSIERYLQIYKYKKKIYSKYINYANINVYLNHTITAVYHSRLQKYRGSHVNKSHDADITAELLEDPSVYISYKQSPISYSILLVLLSKVFNEKWPNPWLNIFQTGMTIIYYLENILLSEYTRIIFAYTSVGGLQ